MQTRKRKKMLESAVDQPEVNGKLLAKLDRLAQTNARHEANVQRAANVFVTPFNGSELLCFALGSKPVLATALSRPLLDITCLIEIISAFDGRGPSYESRPCINYQTERPYVPARASVNDSPRLQSDYVPLYSVRTVPPCMWNGPSFPIEMPHGNTSFMSNSSICRAEPIALLRGDALDETTLFWLLQKARVTRVPDWHSLGELKLIARDEMDKPFAERPKTRWGGGIMPAPRLFAPLLPNRHFFDFDKEYDEVWWRQECFPPGSHWRVPLRYSVNERKVGAHLADERLWPLHGLSSFLDPVPAIMVLSDQATPSSLLCQGTLVQVSKECKTIIGACMTRNGATVGHGPSFCNAGDAQGRGRYPLDVVFVLEEGLDRRSRGEELLVHAPLVYEGCTREVGKLYFDEGAVFDGVVVGSYVTSTKGPGNPERPFGTHSMFDFIRVVVLRGVYLTEKTQVV
jgi:hypothetical protein